jgi:hypothetical protein
MKSDKTFLKNLLISFIVILSSYTLRAQIEVVQCYTSTGSPVVAGDKWYETYNGVEYECICDKSIGADCVPISSSSSSSNYTSSTNDLNGQIMQSIVEPLFQNLLDWIFSPSTPTNTTNSSEYDRAQWEAQNEEYNRLHAEYQKKVLEQVTKANTEYTNYTKEKFENQKQSTVNEFKNRVAKSESVKNIKILNCAASRSLEISHLVIDGQLDFSDLTGPAEDLRALSDFENIKLSDCPEIEVKVPEVTTVNRVAFQEVFFQTIKMKSDSIGIKVGLIKQKEKKIKEVIVEKEKIVEQLKSKEPVVSETNQNKAEEDKLLQEALDALNEAEEEEKKVLEEIQKSEKDIEQLEKIRSVYDIKEKK